MPEHMCDTVLLSRVDRALWRGCASGRPWLQKGRRGRRGRRPNKSGDGLDHDVAAARHWPPPGAQPPAAKIALCRAHLPAPPRCRASTRHYCLRPTPPPPPPPALTQTSIRPRRRRLRPLRHQPRGPSRHRLLGPPASALRCAPALSTRCRMGSAGAGAARRSASASAEQASTAATAAHAACARVFCGQLARVPPLSLPALRAQGDEVSCGPRAAHSI